MHKTQEALLTTTNNPATPINRTMATESTSTEPSFKRQKISKETNYDEVNIITWRKGYTSSSTDANPKPSPKPSPLPLVDLRSKEAYSQHHLKDTCPSSLIVHLPFQDLLSGERSCELPPRHVEFAILVPHNCDRNQLHELFFATCSKATAQSRKPWLVRQVVQETNTLWDDAKEMGMLSSSNGNGNGDGDGDEVLSPLPRLWKPDQMVENVLLPLLRQKLDNSEGNFVVWDLGSGAGRDVTFLAEEIKHQVRMTKSRRNVKIVGFDNHKGSARRSLPLWKNRLVDDVTESRLVNLKNMSLLEDNIREENGLVCLYAIRYLNRRMLDYIASDAALNTGVLFSMSHFCKEENAEWNWDHPKVRHFCNGTFYRMHVRFVFANSTRSV